MHKIGLIGNTPQKTPAIKFSKLILMAVAYLLLGATTLAVNLKSSFINPFFPAAGLAIVLVLHYGMQSLYAIWFGSFFLFICISLSFHDFAFSYVLSAFSIATAATLQTYCAQYLIRKRLKERWRELENERDIFLFLLLAGPISCLVSGTLNTFCLIFLGIREQSHWSFDWWNFYLSDTLGVLLFAPLMIGWLHRKNKQWKLRLSTLTVTTTIMLALTFLVVMTITQWKKKEDFRDLNNYGLQISHQINNHIIALEEILNSLKSFIEVTPDLTVKQFNNYTNSVLQNHTDIKALSYNLIVTTDQRSEFEKYIAEHYPNSSGKIFERNQQQILIPAGNRKQYVAVAFIAPLYASKPAVGYDISSDYIRRDAIQRSLKLNSNTATAPIHLVQDNQNQPGLLVLAPVSKYNPQSQYTEITGFAVAVIKINELIQNATMGFIQDGMNLEVTDPNASRDMRTVYSYIPTNKVDAINTQWNTQLKIADRYWNLRVSGTNFLDSQHRKEEIWLTGVVGLLLTSILQLLFLVITGRNNFIQRQVDSQTAVLHTKNVELKESEARYASVVNHIKEVVFQTDAVGLWTFLNPSWTEVTGFTVEESLGQSFLNYVYPEDRSRNQARFIPLIERKKEDCRHEVRYIHRDGGYRWIEVFARLTLDDRDHVVGTSGTLTDITERKTSIEQLLLAASAFTHTREGIMITNSDKYIIDVNDAFTTITGYERADVLGKKPSILHSNMHDDHFYSTLWNELEQKDIWEGELWNRRKNGEVYVEMLSISKVKNEEGSIQNYIGLFSDITLQKSRQAELEYIAHYDPLTTLPNRLLLADRLNQAMNQVIRNHSSLLVLYIDLDGFKKINDQFGHAVGDQFLKHIAMNMKNELHDGDTISRIGGDEFVAVLIDSYLNQNNHPLIEALLLAASKPINIEGQLHQVTASIGITFYPQTSPVNADQLLSQADETMYQAKLSGKNRFKVFTPLL